MYYFMKLSIVSIVSREALEMNKQAKLYDSKLMSVLLNYKHK